jgi:nucleotide-binding universal stress UspA family protein
MNRILAAVDLSEGTEPVLKFSANLARDEHAHLTLLYAIPATTPINVLASSWGAGTLMVPEVVQSEIDSSRQQLEQLAQNAGFSDVDCLCVRGATADAVREVAEKLHVDLIVTGLHRHGRLFHALFGSTHETIMAKAPCPVVFVPNATQLS